MIPMIVKKPFRPAGTGSPMQAVGAKYMAADKQQARVFRALGWVEDEPVEEPEKVAAILKAPVYTTREVEAKPKRTYRRRDMKAEG